MGIGVGDIAAALMIVQSDHVGSWPNKAGKAVTQSIYYYYYYYYYIHMPAQMRMDGWMDVLTARQFAYFIPPPLSSPTLA